jgi:hypothetical protein
MTDAMNINTLKGKVLLLALTMAGFFAILAIAPRTADADIVHRVPEWDMKYSAGNCTTYARNVETPVLSNYPGYKIAKGFGDVRCSKESYVHVKVALFGWDGGENYTHIRTDERWRRVNPGVINIFRTEYDFCDEDTTAGDYDELQSRITVQTKNDATGQWGDWSGAARSHVLQYNCRA